MPLPTELLLGIFGNLEKVDLKSTRFVCRLFDALVIPLLFDRLCVAPRQRVLETLRNVANEKRIKVHVKELLVDCRSIDYDYAGGWSLEKFYELAATYTRAWKKCLVSGGPFYQALIEILPKLPLLQTVRFTQQWDQPVGWDAAWASIHEARLPKRLYDGNHNGSRDIRESDSAVQCFEQTCKALSVTSRSPVSVICDVTMRAWWKSPATLSSNAFRPTSWLLDDHEVHQSVMDAAFQNTKKLHMTINLDKTSDAAGTNESFSTALGLALLSAQRLEELTLVFNEFEPFFDDARRKHFMRQPFFTFLSPDIGEGDETSWPKLKRLRLSGCRVNLNSLVNFITRHQETLKWVAVKNIELKDERGATLDDWGTLKPKLQEKLGKAMRNIKLNPIPTIALDKQRTGFFVS